MKIILYSLLTFFLVQSYQCQEQASRETTTKETTTEENMVEARSSIETRNFICRGNEPFWNVEISPQGGILYHRMDEGKTQFPYTKPEQQEDVLIYESVTESGTSIIVTIRQSACMDSMSGKEYAFESTVEIKGETLQGCAEARD